ncbi:hypothetical protein MTsPCn5_40110 [Croceitalea sp. MTPC5]|uniref:hypothetical protein n=1 Tax=Croceitalea sp. MTPC5 TaxID=3056565 RepID=UPI002B3758FF|nr:hypothetical protein MTsPCn5_40110 [Croceitalea sp. MTPC5]
MIYLNFTNLDEETQQHLITVSKKDIERKYGSQLKRYTNKKGISYQSLLETEAQRNLYAYKYVFHI